MTERRRPPRRTAASLRQLLRTLDELPDALVVSGADGRIIALNEAAGELFGYSPCELVGEPVESLLPERFREAHVGHRQGYAARPSRRAMGTRTGLVALRRDGSEFPVDLSLSQMATTQGPVVLTGVRDLSERLSMEERLHATERNFRELFENANDIVYTHDFEGNFTAVNPVGLRTFGYGEEDIPRINITQVIDPAYLEIARNEVVRKLQGAERSEPYELLTHATDGTDVWVEVSTRIIREDGRPVGVQGIARNVTDRKTAQKALRETEQRLAGFVENAPVVLFAINTDGAFTLHDGKGLSDLGYPRGQLLGRSVFEVFAGIPSIGENIRRALAGETFASVAEINDRQFEVYHSPIRDEAGEICGMLGVAADATARIEAEQALRTSERRLQAVVSGAPIGLVAFDAEGTIILCEGKALASLSIRADELLGRSVFDVTRPWPVLADMASEALAGHDVSRHVELDGLVFDVQLTPQRDADGRVLSVIVVGMDISERAEAERALRSATEFQDLVMQSTTDAIVAFDMEGRFTLVNRRACEMTGYTPDEMIGQSYALVVAEHRLAETTEALRNTLQHGLPVEAFETDLVRRDGSRAVIAFNLAPMVEHGKIVGAVCTAEDVTERRRAASLLAAEARLLETIAAGPPTLDALDSIARLVEEHATDLRCVIRVKGGDGLGWRCRAAPGVPADFIAMMDEAIAGPLGGTVRDGGEVIVADVADDPQWAPARAWVMAQDIRAVGMLPIWSSDGSVIGILSIYGARPGEPDKAQRELVGVATHLAGIVIERVRDEEARRASEERYRQIFERNTALKLLVDPDTGRIVDANPAATEFYGYSHEELTGMTVFDLNQAPREFVLEELARARAEDRSYFQFRHRLASGEIRDIEIYAGPIDVGSRTLICSIIHDIAERKLTERQLAAQRHLLELIAMGEPLERVLDMIVSAVEEQAPGALCSVLLLTPDGGHLSNASAPSLPAAYNAAIQGVAIGPSAGSCGTAAYRREPVVVTDIAADPLWDGHRDLALAHGLRSCWSTPIFSGGGDVLGTFAIYYREPRAPVEADTALIRIATHVAGIAIERQRAEHAERSRTEELQQLYGQLVSANAELAESKERLEEKSLLLEQSLDQERERGRRDPLTSTLNHAAIAEALRDLIAERDSEPVAVAMVDVDGLKAANDTYGHQVGDAVLVLVARALDQHGAIVGRYGGDEFVAILPGADRRAGEAYRNAVLASLADARVTDPHTGTPIPIVASMGLAVYPEEAEAMDDLIRLSDSAMYASRRQRVAAGDSSGLSRALGSERAARMVGEIVPLLTSPGDLSNKLRLVSHRLSVGAGYDAVNFALTGPNQASVTSSTIRDLSERDHEAWSRQARRSNSELTKALHATRRPLIVDDIATDQRLQPQERSMLARAGIRSALVAPMLWHGELIGSLSVGSRHVGAFSAGDVEFVIAVATQVTAIVRMSSMLNELQASSARLMRAHTETVLMLAGAAEAHDHTTGRHLQRVSGLTEALARELGHSEEQARDLGLAAVLHDIGKIRVPDMVLGSSAKLAESEWVLMKQHTIWGSEFLAGQQGFELAAQVARSHHERWDGGGYPDGLVGDAIPESAQITAVADAFDAMTNDRPYRLGRPMTDAVAEIVACAGTQFSPRVVDALVRLHARGELPFLQGEDHEAEAEAA